MPTTIIASLICLFFGAGAVYFIMNKKENKLKADKAALEATLSAKQADNERLSAQNAALSEQNQQKQNDIAELSNKISADGEREKALREKLEVSENEYSELDLKNNELTDKLEKINSALSDERSRSAAEQEKTKWVEEADKSLREAFNSLSKNIMENNNKVFLESANDKLKDFAEKLNEKMSGENKAVEGIINPVGEQLKELTKQVTEMEKLRAAAYSGLTSSVDELKKQNDILKDETRSLNSALRNTSVRGKWGETQLRKIAELCGMSEHIDYVQQRVNTDGLRPDMTVQMTGNRTIPVDSKVPMDDYLIFAQSNDEQERKASIEKHVKAVKKHVDELSKKEYWKSEDRAVSFVVMIIPYESGLSATFQADTNIFEYALEKNVLLLSPMTFYAFLKSVSLGWTEFQMNENAKEIARLSGELIDRIEKFFSHFEGIGTNLQKSVEKYNDAIKSYNSRLMPTFNKLRLLNTKDETLALDELPSDVHIPKNE